MNLKKIYVKIDDKRERIEDFIADKIFKKLDENKRSIARIFGLGKSSKSKPGPLLEKSRELYDQLTATLNEANIISVDD